MPNDKKRFEGNPTLRIRKSYPHNSKPTNIKGVRLCSDDTYFSVVVIQGVFWGVEGFRTKKEASAAREKVRQEMVERFGPCTISTKRHDTWVTIGQNSGKVWYLRSPQGERVKVDGIPQWAQENAKKFNREPNASNGQAIARSFYNLKRSYLGNNQFPNYLFMPISYYGWYVDGWEDEFGLHPTYGPPLRGELKEIYEAARKPYLKRMRAASRKKAYDKNRADKREAYHRIKAEIGHGPSAITGYYETYFDCDYEPVAKRVPMVLRSPDGELIPVASLPDWVRNNCEQCFGREPTSANVTYIRQRLGHIRGRKATNGEPLTAMGGWSVFLPEEVE